MKIDIFITKVNIPKIKSNQKNLILKNNLLNGNISEYQLVIFYK